MYKVSSTGRIAALTLTVIAAIALAAPAALAQSLLVNFGSDLAVTFTAPPGDQFVFTGQSGSVTLTAGVSQNVVITNLVQNLGFAWDDLPYNVPLPSNVTINGITTGFSQTATIVDNFTPSISITGAPTQTFVIAGGTVDVTLNALAATTAPSASASATLLFTPSQVGAVPEPSAIVTAVAFAGLLGGLVVRKRRAK